MIIETSHEAEYVPPVVNVAPRNLLDIYTLNLKPFKTF